MPRSITRWQRRKAAAVGTETRTKPAITHHGWWANVCDIWYIHTASVQWDSFWHTRNAHSHDEYACMNELSAFTARMGVVIGSVMRRKTVHSPAPSIAAAADTTSR